MALATCQGYFSERTQLQNFLTEHYYEATLEKKIHPNVKSILLS